MRLDEEFVRKQLHQHPAYLHAALFTGYEALFLCMLYGQLGKIARKDARDAVTSLQELFGAALHDNAFRGVMANAEMNLLRGDCEKQLSLTNLEAKKEAAAEAAVLQRRLERRAAMGDQVLHVVTAVDQGSVQAAPEDAALATSPHGEDPQVLSPEAAAHIDLVMRCVAAVDRANDVVAPVFEQALADEVLVQLRKDFIAGRSSKNFLQRERVERLKTCLTCLIHVAPADPKGAAARTRMNAVLL